MSPRPLLLAIAIVLAASMSAEAAETVRGRILSMEPSGMRLTLQTEAKKALRLDVKEFVGRHGEAALNGLDVGLSVVAEAEPPKEGNGAWTLLGIRRAEESEEVRVQSDLFDEAPSAMVSDAPKNDAPGRKGLFEIGETASAVS